MVIPFPVSLAAFTTYDCFFCISPGFFVIVSSSVLMGLQLFDVMISFPCFSPLLPFDAPGLHNVSSATRTAGSGFDMRGGRASGVQRAWILPFMHVLIPAVFVLLSGSWCSLLHFMDIPACLLGLPSYPASRVFPPSLLHSGSFHSS